MFTPAPISRALRSVLLLMAFTAVCLAFCPSITYGYDSGYFTVGRSEGRWWFVDPYGEIFFSTGSNVIHPGGYFAPDLGYSPYHKNIIDIYGSEEAWADVVLERMDQWNINTLGGWGDIGLFADSAVYTRVLDLSGADWVHGIVPDYFSQDFLDRVESICSSTVAARADDPNMLGWFLDNELRWGPDWRTFKDLFSDYFAFSADAPGKIALVEFLRDRYDDDIDAFNAAWATGFVSFDALLDETVISGLPATPAQWEDREAFLGLVADQYFDVTTSGVRKYDSNHLVLGCRFVSWLTPSIVVETSADYLDVASVNHYRIWPVWMEATQGLRDEIGVVPVDELNALTAFHELTDLPILISEFSIRSMDAGLPNTHPPYWIFLTATTQSERADIFENIAQTWIDTDYVIGYHWFAWMDEPESGRFDGENSNFGLVTEEDEPWEILVERVTEVNARVYDWEPPDDDDDDDDTDDDDDDDTVDDDDDDDDSGIDVDDDDDGSGRCGCG